MTGIRTPLTPWLGGRGDAARIRRALGRRPLAVAARDRTWRAIAPDFETCVAMARSGLPFQIAAERRYDRSADPRRIARALAAGETIFLPQVHQVLPRLARLIVALRAAFMGPGREETSFLFIVEGTGRQAMGLHHDGAVDAFWLQLDGRRTVTLGPPVPPGAPEDLPDDLPRHGRGWRTLDLPPGALLYLPARTPHEVVCYGRSLAISLTWRLAKPRRRGAAALAGLLAWDVVAGRVGAIPPTSRSTLWTQLPAVASRDGAGVVVRTADGDHVRLDRVGAPLARALPLMPSLRAGRHRGLAPLIERGVLAPQDLPLAIRPEDPAALDGWRFA